MKIWDALRAIEESQEVECSLVCISPIKWNSISKRDGFNINHTTSANYIFRLKPKPIVPIAPLECWVNVYTNGEYGCFKTEKEASVAENILYGVIHMKEVKKDET